MGGTRVHMMEGGLGCMLGGTRVHMMEGGLGCMLGEG